MPSLVALPNGTLSGRWLHHLAAVLRRIDPDRGIDNISPFYFTVMGTCLSFVLVFKSNIAYNRHAAQGSNRPQTSRPQMVCCSHV